MTIINKEVVSVKDLLSEPLAIPDYQRPYKWQDKHVNQLLNDVIRHKNKGSYRLGTVVLHDNERKSTNQFYIVDGQQRLLTLTLICFFLDTGKLFSPSLLKIKFNSVTTEKNLQHNSAVIQSRLKQLSEADREELVDYLLHKCELIVVTLDDLNEAFQFFDSQNARGKELEPYDLLKAFHLREMGSNSEDEKLNCVGKWESEVSPSGKTPSLHTIMSDYLFRLRCWSSGESGRFFTRNNIDVFKGVNLDQGSYPFALSMRALDYQVDQYNSDSVRRWDEQFMSYPFQVDQTILNGKRFFEYIQNYINLYQILFIEPKPELEKLLTVINNYKGCSRKGDHYVRNLFLCMVMFYYDKFGDNELEKAAKLCFLWSYRIRLEQNRVVIESIDNHAKGQNELLRVIKNALHPHEVLAFPLVPVLRTNVKGTKVDGLLEEFEALGYLQS